MTRHDAPTSPVGTPIVIADAAGAPARQRGEAEEPAAHLIAGEVAVDVARELAEPMRVLRDRLGLVVDHLEHHVGTATGPTPYPWRALQVLRHDLAAAYLEATTLARRLDDLDRALAVDPPGWFDAAAAVELGLALAGHHLTSGLELLIDLGHTPPARGTAGTFALLVAQLIAASASSARDLPGSTLSVRVTREVPEAGDAAPGEPGPGAWALVTVADNGAGSARAAALGELVRGVVAPWGALVDATTVPGAGCVFELRLATA